MPERHGRGLQIPVSVKESRSFSCWRRRYSPAVRLIPYLDCECSNCNYNLYVASYTPVSLLLFFSLSSLMSGVSGDASVGKSTSEATEASLTYHEATTSVQQVCS